MQTVPASSGVKSVAVGGLAHRTAREPRAATLGAATTPRASSFVLRASEPGTSFDPRSTAHEARSYDLAAYSRPARTFTGDFYLTHRAADRLWFALGDVAGKGAHAAVVMAMIQEELEHRITSCASTRCNPARTMQRLHEFLVSILPSNRFATVTIGHLRDDGVLTIANAGHCPPLIASARGVESIASTGPVAGLLPGATWCSVTRQLAAGDSLLVFTDGLLEAQAANGDEFGSERIRDFFARAAAESRDAATIVSRLVAGAQAHAPEFDDDLTVLALRYAG